MILFKTQESLHILNKLIKRQIYKICVNISPIVSPNVRFFDYLIILLDNDNILDWIL